MSVSNENQWLIVTSCSIFFVLVLLPFIIYYWFIFNKRRNEMVIDKRWPLTVKIINIFVILLILQRPLAFIVMCSPLIYNNFLNWLFYARLANITFSLFGYGTIWCFLCRFWIMYYELKYSSSAMNSKWKSHLNPSLIDKDFWLKYKKTLGSEKYIFLSSFIGWILFCLPSIILRNLKLSKCKNYSSIHCVAINTSFLNIGMNLILLIIFVILMIQTPKILDIWYLKFELNCLNKAILSTIIIVLILNGITFFNQKNELIIYFVTVLRVIIVGFGYSLLALISTLFVLKRIDKDIKLKSKLKIESNSSDIDDSLSKYKLIKLSTILKDENNFLLFIQHLCRECAVELLLCFIELLQFKYNLNSIFNLSSSIQTIKTKTNDDNNNNNYYDNNDCFDFNSCNLENNHSIPKSSIVYNQETNNNQNIKQFLQIAHILYVKYIKPNGELEVNISGELKKYYFDHMDDLNEFLERNNKKDDDDDIKVTALELFQLFDQVIEEMYNLMLDSSSRFLETEPNITLSQLHSNHVKR